VNGLIGQTLLHYKVLDKLGQGGMGVVYKAEDSKLKREVAIKFLPYNISSDAEERQRFEIEAQAAAALNHPNIATIYSIEESGKDVFIAMEFINGIELKEKIKKERPNLDEARNIIEQIASGLSAAHQKGIIHRDIKSANIMITKSGLIKIMDFGLAKIGGTSQITRFGTTLGTTAYMSPEQARGEKVDTRTDIWSMGVIFYEMLTGDLPFKGEFDQAIIYSILNVEPEPIISISKDLPVKFQNLIEKLLTKDRDKRYQKLEEFLADLKETKDTKTQLHDTKEDNKSIAVLPFENMSSDKEIEYFSDGLTEEIIGNLTGLKGMTVIPRTSSMQFKGTNKDINRIGKELGSRYIITGSVRKFQDNLRISVQRLDLNNNKQLWAKTFKGNVEDIFDISENVTKEIVNATKAFDCYLQAREFITRRTKNSVQLAVDLFEKAIMLDPLYSAAYAGLGEAYGIIYRDFDRNESLLDKALEVGLKAVEFDPTSSEAYAALGLSYFGKSELSKALEAAKKAITLDEKNYNAYWILSRIYHTEDRDQEAADALEKLLKINPEFLLAYQDLQMYYARLNQNEKHVKHMNRMLEVYPEYLKKHPDDSYTQMTYACTLAIVSRKEEAIAEGEKALKYNSKDPVMMYYGACLYSTLNEKQQAIGYLKKAIENGYGNFEWIKRDPDFENIRKEPGYIELVKGK
jgi:serine/threonine protein kinase/tetratricopeptide (TPR) repeat protein